MRVAATNALVWTMLCCALGVAPASAQTVSITAPSPGDASDLPPLSAEESAALGNALMFDPTTVTSAKPAKPLRLPSLSNPKGLDVSHTDRPDGSRTVVVKQPLATEWDSKVGADLGLGPQAGDYQPSRPLASTRDNSSGAAWASLGVADVATVDARVEPSKDQGKLGTTFKQKIPVGSQFAVTLQNTYSVTETLSAQTVAPSSDLPLATMPTTPTPATAATPANPQVWGNEKLAKFDVLPTGTTLAAGLASTSTDPVTHNKFSAEQKIYGPLQVTTAVSDLGQPVPNKSISAKFKLNW